MYLLLSQIKGFSESFILLSVLVEDLIHSLSNDFFSFIGVNEDQDAQDHFSDKQN